MITTPRERYLEEHKFLFFKEKDGFMIDSEGFTAKQACERIRTDAILAVAPYPISREERNMFLLHIIEAVMLAEPTDADKIIVKAKQILDRTEYLD